MKSLKVDDLCQYGTTGTQFLESSTYIGFAIGQQSWHSSVYIDAGEGWQLCSVGSPLVLNRPFQGRPKVRFWRPTWEQYALAELIEETASTYTAPKSKAHVLGFECASELALTPARRAPYERYQSIAYADTLGANGAVAVVPFQGRRHAVFYVGGSGPPVCAAPQIVGIRYGGPLEPNILSYATGPLFHTNGEDMRDQFAFAAAADLSANKAIHVGGSGDEEEMFDELMLVCGDGVLNQDFELSVQVWGEAGD